MELKKSLRKNRKSLGKAFGGVVDGKIFIEFSSY